MEKGKLGKDAVKEDCEHLGMELTMMLSWEGLVNTAEHSGCRHSS